MRVLIISDIHANLNALDSVIGDAGSFDAAWCLGDLVGYGPDPNECIDRVKQLPNLKCILGNHDAAALTLIETDSFNPEARAALQWTQTILTPASMAFLKNLPETIENETVTLAHGSPRHPVWEYMLDAHTAALNFTHFDTPYCFVGHTHMPVIYQSGSDSRAARIINPNANEQLALQPRAILNPGSVGQPRDRDPRAAYAIFDTQRSIWNYRRVDYDILGVQMRMIEVGLPQRHVQRLTAGW